MLVTFIFNFLFNLNNNIVHLDSPEPFQYGFQDGASPGFDGIVALHDSILFYLILIMVSVFWIMFTIIITYFNSTKSGLVYKYLNHGTMLELVWTITPALVLVAIAFPSFKLLYTLDEVIEPALTIKVSGNHLDSLDLKNFAFPLVSFVSWYGKRELLHQSPKGCCLVVVVLTYYIGKPLVEK